MASGGWRILFGIAIILVVLSFFIKHSGDDNNKSKDSKDPVKLSTLFKYKKSMLYMILLCLPGAVIAYFPISILPNIITEVLGDKTVNVAILTTISLIVFIASCMVASRLTKYLSIKTIITIGLVLMVILPLPMFALYKSHSDALIIFFIVMAAIFGIFYGNIMVIFTESFPKEIRYTGFALAYNIGFGLFGAVLPFACFFLASEVSVYSAIGVISFSAIIGLITLYFLEPDIVKEHRSL
jgi:MHS family proline/betaine transporter-like MFS transporter